MSKKAKARAKEMDAPIKKVKIITEDGEEKEKKPDFPITEYICNMLNPKNSILITLDLSWSRLSPKQLRDMMEALTDENIQPNLRNFNVSYNSLFQFPTDETIFADDEHPLIVATDDFVYLLVAFIQKTNLLRHLDISGMNFN